MDGWAGMVVVGNTAAADSLAPHGLGKQIRTAMASFRGRWAVWLGRPAMLRGLEDPLSSD
jgi:hypothetical protein